MIKADLFSKAQERRPKPLAAEIHPQTLDELIGQQHILGPHGPLRRRSERAVSAQSFSSAHQGWVKRQLPGRLARR